MSKTWRLRPFIWTSLFAFHAVFLILLTAALWIGVTYLMTEQTSRTRLDTLLDKRQQTAEYLRQIEETALTVSTGAVLRETLNKVPDDLYERILKIRELTDWMNSTTFLKPYISSIFLYTDKPGLATGFSDRILPLDKIPWPEERSRLSDVDSIWIPAHRATSAMADSGLVLTYVAKVFNKRGEMQGYLEINLDERALAAVMKGNQLAPVAGRTVYLLDPNGRLMDSLPNMEKGTDNWGKLQPIIDTNEQGYTGVQLNGSRFISIYTPRREAEWRMVELLPAEEIQKSAQTIRNIVLIMGAISLILSFPVASYLSARIARPVPSLLEGFSQIQKGDFDARVGWSFITEFQQLSHAFNSTAKQLHLLIERNKEENRLKRDAELKALQSQINPHFLYNTLDMINWMAAMKGAEDVSLMAARLARLFRISLNRGNTFITLRDELEHALAYVQIQQARFKDQFVYEETIDPRLMPCLVPKVIIQPFIENAIIHGFKQMPVSDRKAHVSVYSEFVEADRYRIIVQDNGSGLNTAVSAALTAGMEATPQTVSGSSGYGLANVTDRLRMYFGDGFGVELQPVSENGSGVKVVLTLPFVQNYEQLEKLQRGVEENEGIDRR